MDALIRREPLVRSSDEINDLVSQVRANQVEFSIRNSLYLAELSKMGALEVFLFRTRIRNDLRVVKHHQFKMRQALTELHFNLKSAKEL